MSQRAIPTTDRISSLPDEVLCHILSLLPTKAAAATSILSKRWIRLWLLVPILHFDDGSYDQSKETYSGRFNKSVYAAILSRDVHQPIKTFRLTCLSPSHCDDPSDVNIWVNAVLQRRVEHLELSMPCFWLAGSSIKMPLPLPLPSGILSCRTLVVLKMKLLYVKAFLCVDLPSLKILHLDWRDLFDDIDSITKDIIPMFQNLAHIELISIDYPNWHKVVEVLKHCPKLEILVIEKKNFEFFPEEENIGEDWPYPQSVPKCILLHLRTCRLTNYEGSKGEFRFARYIMQNATLLRTMTICSTSASNRPEKLKMIKKIILVHKALCNL